MVCFGDASDVLPSTLSLEPAFLIALFGFREGAEPLFLGSALGLTAGLGSAPFGLIPGCGVPGCCGPGADPGCCKLGAGVEPAALDATESAGVTAPACESQGPRGVGAAEGFAHVGVTADGAGGNVGVQGAAADCAGLGIAAVAATDAGAAGPCVSAGRREASSRAGSTGPARGSL